MKRFAIALFALVAFAVPVAAQQYPLSQPFTLTKVGQRTPTLTLQSNMGTCSIVVTNGGTFTLVPQAASDGITNPQTPSWVTAGTIHGGSLTTTGTYTGSIAGIGLSSFGALATSVDSTPVVGTIICATSPTSPLATPTP